MALDSIDKEILRILQRDGRLSNRDLAAAVGLSAAPCLRRVQRLEEQGYISGYAALVDRDLVGRGLTVFVTVRLAQHTKHAIERFEAEVGKDPAVLECHWTAGETDYLLKVAVADLPGLDRFLLDRMTRIPGVATLQSGIAIRTVKHTTAVPVD
ncbi:Lrp/AsnC family transcriptional regulator [Amycolatopsis sp. OK19-0408]|uniref:Lrp/AsnC family transcriptional regulator n=1 Tax=Amycolatopsis iheyensis TaxID=2945988 RepID=A0A9X2NJL0_9PSEU|nr:Lrp/AsnC family transcriptional regulator [Amycolatopsis iheyensis]MCR6488691.1 Lrp/AsnC family transcriptional regulator [Amycolatopsis iheyensis]